MAKILPFTGVTKLDLPPDQILDGAKGKLMGLVAHCADIKYDDGQARQPGWITIKTMGSAWVVECKDPDTTAVLRVVQATLDDALALASVLLESEEAPWEQDKWLQQQKLTSARKK